MTLPTSGALALSQVQTEFGGTNPVSMSEYYAGGGRVAAGASGNSGVIPASGPVSLSFYRGSPAVVATKDSWALYEFNFDGTNVASTSQMNNEGICIDVDQNIYIVYACSQANLAGVYVEKYNAFGVKIWGKKFAYTPYPSVLCSAKPVIVGTQLVFGVNATSLITRVFSINLSDGAITWQRSFTGATGGCAIYGIYNIGGELLVHGVWQLSGTYQCGGYARLTPSTGAHLGYVLTSATATGAGNPCGQSASTPNGYVATVGAQGRTVKAAVTTAFSTTPRTQWNAAVCVDAFGDLFHWMSATTQVAFSSSTSPNSTGGKFSHTASNGSALSIIHGASAMVDDPWGPISCIAANTTDTTYHIWRMGHDTHTLEWSAKISLTAGAAAFSSGACAMIKPLSDNSMYMMFQFGTTTANQGKLYLLRINNWYANAMVDRTIGPITVTASTAQVTQTAHTVADGNGTASARTTTCTTSSTADWSHSDSATQMNFTQG